MNNTQIDPVKAVEAQLNAIDASAEIDGIIDEHLLTADQLRELFAERDRYKAALEFIASSSNCGTCDACLRAAEDALR